MTSIQRQISEDGYPKYLDLENDACINSDLPEIPREERMTAVFYEQENGIWLTAYSPKPPTLEAIKKAQFVDKTYVWKESSKTAKPS